MMSMPGIVSFSGWRSRSENRRVPGMRPSRATGGSDARRINRMSGMTAPIITPRSKPCPSTPNMATIAMTNSRPSLRQRCLRADTLTRPSTATNTTAANTGWGNALSSCEKNKHYHQNECRRDGTGQWHSRAPTLVDDGLRHAAADREPLAEPRGKVGRAERQKFLVGVQPPAVLGRERAADGRRLHRGQQEAREGQGQHFVQVFPTNRGEAKVRQPLRHFAEQLHPARVQPEKARNHDAGHHDQ